MTVTGLAPAELDPLAGPALHERLPGLRTALDGAQMTDHLAAALGVREPLVCTPGQASYLGDSCLVRYGVEVARRSTVVTGRVFPDDDACAGYVAQRLDPLAANAPSGPFERTVGTVPGLHLALSVFPVDGDLPTLVGATDTATMLGHLRTAVQTLDPGLDVSACEVEPGHYGRQHRCVLRYLLRVQGPAGAAAPLVVYGKVAADDRGEHLAEVVAALRSQAGPEVAVPRLLGYLPGLRLGLFEALPGVPRVAQLVRAGLADVPAQDHQPPTLESALRSCARIAALLHTSGIGLGRQRPLAGEAATLHDALEVMRPLSPALADRLAHRLDAAVAGAAAPMPAVFSHGDFSYTQLIFDGDRPGLVDFDTLCQAEPALDLGHFLAYLELAGRKSRSGDTSVVGDMRRQFLTAYASRCGLADPEPLVAQASVYETVSLLRLAVHSWQKLKPRRLRLVLDALDDATTQPR